MIVLLASLMLADLSQQQAAVGNRYQSANGGPRAYLRPAWATNPIYSTETVNGTSKFKLTFSSTPSVTGYKTFVEAFFPAGEQEDGIFSKRSVVAVLNGISYQSTPVVSSSQAAVIDRMAFTQAGTASFTWNGNELTVSYGAALVENKSPIYVRMFCIPENFSMTNVRGGTINNIVPIPLYEAEDVDSRMIEPVVPE